MQTFSRRHFLLGSSLALTWMPAAAATAQGRRAAAAASKAVTRSQAHGGHLHRHVGRSNGGLAAQAASKTMRLNFNAARLGIDTQRGSKIGNKGFKQAPAGYRREARNAARKLQVYRLSKRQASTFKSAKAADKMYANAVRSNRATIKKWLKQSGGKRGSPLPIPFNAGAAVGSVYSARTKTHRVASKGAFYLQKVEGTNKFYPVSAKLY